MHVVASEIDRCCLRGMQGEIVEAYRKIHLFDHDKLTESRSTAPGREVRRHA